MKLQVYDKDKGYHLTIGVFYGYADYTYVKRSWRYLLSVIPVDVPDHKAYYEQFCNEDCVSIEMTAEDFRKYITRYCEEWTNWYPAWKPYFIDTTHWKFVSLYKSPSNKILVWKHYDPKCFRARA